MWLHFCHNKFRNSGLCARMFTQSFCWMYTRKQWSWPPSIHTHGATGLSGLERTLTHQVLPPGQGGWHSHSSEQVLTVPAPGRELLPGIKGSQPFLACCKYFAVSTYSLFQSSTLQKIGYSQGKESNWDCFFQHLQLPLGVLLEFSSLQGTMTTVWLSLREVALASNSHLPKLENHKQQPQEELKRRVLLRLKCYKSLQLK